MHIFDALLGIISARFRKKKLSAPLSVCLSETGRTDVPRHLGMPVCVSVQVTLPW